MVMWPRPYARARRRCPGGHAPFTSRYGGAAVCGRVRGRGLRRRGCIPSPPSVVAASAGVRVEARPDASLGLGGRCASVGFGLPAALLRFEVLWRVDMRAGGGPPLRAAGCVAVAVLLRAPVGGARAPVPGPAAARRRRRGPATRGRPDGARPAAGCGPSARAPAVSATTTYPYARPRRPATAWAPRLPVAEAPPRPGRAPAPIFSRAGRGAERRRRLACWGAPSASYKAQISGNCKTLRIRKERWPPPTTEVTGVRA